MSRSIEFALALDLDLVVFQIFIIYTFSRSCFDDLISETTNIR